jgi:putative chitinase
LVSAVLAPCLALVSSLAPSPSAADEATDEGVGARSISRPVPPGNTFPVPAPHDVSFSDSWHACRDGCRRQHKGNDLMAAEGTPVVAVESGVIARVDNRDDGNGGLSVWLLGDSGVAYYYAHNSANLVVPGQPVARGQVIARVGHTGNARTTPPHIHFQVNTCGELSSAEPCTVDPHDDLRAWPQELIDGGADAVGVYMPTDATFRLRTDGGSPLPPAAFGSVADGSRPVAGDWDGDGRDTVGVFRPHDATFLLRDDAGAPLAPVPAGQPGDLPVVGDWDGDGRDTVGYYRPATATFRLHDESGRALPPVTFGTPVAGTAPVAASNPAVGPEGATTPDAPPAADGPGVGANLAAVARAAGPPIPPASTFTPHAPVVDAAPAAPGAPQVVPVAGDWDGDRRDTVALFRPVDATFVVRDRSGAARPPVLYGRPGDLPLVGDWDGDGRDTFGVYRPHDASYHLQGFTDRPGQATEAGEAEAAAVPAAVPEPQGPLVFGPAMTPGAQPVAGDWNGHDLVTADDLHAIFGADLDEVVAAENLALLNQAMVQAGAVTPGRKAALLATLHGESGLRHDAVEGGSSAWRGRGFIQLTGEGNYRRAGRDLGVDLLDDAGLAVDPEISAAVASWYWTVARNLNLAADRLDMAAVNIAMGYGPSPQEDLERCADFLRALAWFTGGNVPTGVNCERTPRAFETARAAMEPPQPPAEPGPDDPAAPAPGSPDRPPPPSDTSTPAPPPTSSTTLPSPTTSPPTTGQPPTPPSTTTTTTAPPPTTTTTGPPPTAPPESTTTTTGQPTTTTTATTPPTTNPP